MDTLRHKNVGLWIDFENLAIEVSSISRGKKLALNAMLEAIGGLAPNTRIIEKKAYADWANFRDYTSTITQLGIVPVTQLSSKGSGKNGADIQIVVDCLSSVYESSCINTVVLVTGDSDFAPLVHKLRSKNIYVIGIGFRTNSSPAIVSACDEFWYYESKFAHVYESYEDVLRNMNFHMVTDRQRRAILYSGATYLTEWRKKTDSFTDYASINRMKEFIEDDIRWIDPKVLKSVLFHMFHTYTFSVTPDTQDQLWNSPLTGLHKDIKLPSMSDEYVHRTELMDNIFEFVYKSIYAKLAQKLGYAPDAALYTCWLYPNDSTDVDYIGHSGRALKLVQTWQKELRANSIPNLWGDNLKDLKLES
jgi:uncharacterized LabA/DUF88 family protein